LYLSQHPKSSFLFTSTLFLEVHLQTNQLPSNMKGSILSGALALLAASASAAPSGGYPAPPGGYDEIKYPAGTGENLPYYPPPSGKGECRNGPFKFTSTYSIVATPDQVVNGTTPTGGLPGCTGIYDFGINSDLDLICWSIKLVGFRGNYTSPARTATHIHQAARGASGPPRVTFPNPVGTGNERSSYGCQTGKFNNLAILKYSY
jgi:CHRD domain